MRCSLFGLNGLIVAARLLWNTDLGRKWLFPYIHFTLAPNSPVPHSPLSIIQGKVLNAIDYGAISDDDRSDTTAIQQALDECAKLGGGEVHLSRGEFVAGQIRLPDRVVLVIGKGAVLRASRSRADFPDRVWIRAENAKDIGIRGPGKLVGNGSSYFHIKLTNQRLFPQSLTTTFSASTETFKSACTESDIFCLASHRFSKDESYRKACNPRFANIFRASCLVPGVPSRSESSISTQNGNGFTPIHQEEDLTLSTSDRQRKQINAGTSAANSPPSRKKEGGNHQS